VTGDHLRGVDLDDSLILRYILKIRRDYMDRTYLFQVINYLLSVEDNYEHTVALMSENLTSSFTISLT